MVISLRQTSRLRRPWATGVFWRLLFFAPCAHLFARHYQRALQASANCLRKCNGTFPAVTASFFWLPLTSHNFVAATCFLKLSFLNAVSCHFFSLWFFAHFTRKLATFVLIWGVLVIVPLDNAGFFVLCPFFKVDVRSSNMLLMQPPGITTNHHSRVHMIALKGKRCCHQASPRC